MYYKIILKSRNKNCFKLIDSEGNLSAHALVGFMQVGDVFKVVNGRIKLLTDDDEEVTMNHPDRKRLVRYGTFLPIQTPPTIRTP